MLWYHKPLRNSQWIAQRPRHITLQAMERPWGRQGIFRDYVQDLTVFSRARCRRMTFQRIWSHNRLMIEMIAASLRLKHGIQPKTLRPYSTPSGLFFPLPASLYS